VPIGVGLLVVLDAALVRAGLSAGAIPAAEGSSAWTASRAAGLTAFVAITLDVVFGLFVSTGAADRFIARARSIEVHRFLSTVALGLAAVHALALLGDRAVRFDAFDLLVPFLSGYRPLAVGLGVLAAYGAVVVHVSFALRRRIGAKTWRKLHYLSFAVFVLGLGHGLLAGSDSASSGFRFLYAASAAVVATLVLHRLLVRRR
jgi:predicted ferric reductase